MTKQEFETIKEFLENNWTLYDRWKETEWYLPGEDDWIGRDISDCLMLNHHGGAHDEPYHYKAITLEDLFLRPPMINVRDLIHDKKKLFELKLKGLL